jgi:hypothetical protein
LSRVSGRGTLAEAIRYALFRWQGLARFLHDGRIELDTNPVERAIRPVALGRNYAHPMIMRSSWVQALRGQRRSSAITLSLEALLYA